jgi:PTS system fructose-specific IIA component
MTIQDLKISEVIRPETIDLDLKGVGSKDDLINCLADKLETAGLLVDKEAYIESVHEREKLGPTYMGNFIAIPHGKSPAVREAGIAFGRSLDGFEYITEDGGGIVKLVFLLAIPDRTSPDAYMAVLAKLARLLVHEEFREELMVAKDYNDVFTAIKNGEQYLID